MSFIFSLLYLFSNCIPHIFFPLWRQHLLSNWNYYYQKVLQWAFLCLLIWIESSSTSPKKKHKRKHKKHKKKKDHGPEGYDEERKKEKSKDKNKSREKEKDVDKSGGRAVKLKIKLRGETVATTQWVTFLFSVFFFKICFSYLIPHLSHCYKLKIVAAMTLYYIFKD